MADARRPQPRRSRRPRPARPAFRIAFRLGAVLIGLAPLVVLELVLQLLDIGRPGDYSDPFVGFRDVRPLFVESADGERFEIPPGRLSFFRPDSFAARKSPEEFRVFCLGGSTVQGRPFSIETSFAAFLELGLRASSPEREFRVINCGGVSYASYRLVPILEEVLGHAPDLIVLYTGHNEFLEARTYAHIRDMSNAVARPLQALSRLRTFVLLREGVMRLRGTAPRDANADARGTEAREIMSVEADALLDHRGAMEQYTRDPEWRRDVIAHYANSVRRMMALCRDAGVPLILVRPAANLRDCPPFKSQPRDDLAPDEERRFRELLEEARTAPRDPEGMSAHATDLHESIELLRAAIAIDDEHAAVRYELAKCLDRLGRFEQAREQYRRALDADICPLRMLEPMHEELGAIARASEVPLVDARALFERLSDDGVPGEDWFVDHVHPSIAGHEAIAELLLDAVVELGLVTRTTGWKERRERLVRERLESLDDFYYVRGRNRLDAVKRWARGMSRDP